MEKGIKAFGLMTMLVLGGAIIANAQSSLTVSKGVQHVANKKAFEDEKARKSQLQANSVEFPAIVVSKGVAGSSETATVGNMESTGYPAVAVSKGVARQSLQKSQKKAKQADEPGREFTNDGNEISRK
jgi:hypothetical protein